MLQVSGIMKSLDVGPGHIDDRERCGNGRGWYWGYHSQSDFVDSQKAFNVSLVSLFSISKACHLFVDWHQINILASTIEQLSPRVLCGLAGGV